MAAHGEQRERDRHVPQPRSVLAELRLEREREQHEREIRDEDPAHCAPRATIVPPPAKTSAAIISPTGTGSGRARG